MVGLQNRQCVESLPEAFSGELVVDFADDALCALGCGHELVVTLMQTGHCVWGLPFAMDISMW